MLCVLDVVIPRLGPVRAAKYKYFVLRASYVNREVFRSLEVSSC